MALMAYCLLAKVTKAQALLFPVLSLSTEHSSMVPYTLNMFLTSFSVNFLDSIPTNNLRSETKSIGRYA